jgi:4-hydroxy-tetrahydrodipicolinate reductase
MSGKIRIAVNGAAGRMGRSVTRLVLEDGELELAAALERPGHPELGRDAALLAGLPAECGVRLSVAAAETAVDCFIAYSTPDATIECLRSALQVRAAMVAGTTGLSKEQNAEFADAARVIPLVLAPNTGVGANLLISLASDAAQALGAGYDVEIVEVHHRHKADAPSGTALRLAEKVAEARGVSLAGNAVHGRSGRPGARPRDEIGIHAVRAGDIIGEHTVIFATEGERIELVHRVTSRDGFCKGALRAAKFLAGRRPGSYSMAEVLGLG